MDVEAVARELSVARKDGSVLTPPSRRHPSFSLKDGYAVGRLLHQERLASGAEPVGLKLGFTNKAAWTEFGLDSPFWAPIYDTTVNHKTGVSLSGLVAPRIEPEIVLGFRADLHPNASPAEISAAIGWAAVGFEIVQCHYPNWEMTPPDAVADAGLHGVLVVGDHTEVHPPDGEELVNVEVELRRGELLVAIGRGANALGGPVQAVAWLLRLPGVEGIQAGDVVTTGSLTTALPVASGESWQLDTAGPVALHQLRVRLSGARLDSGLSGPSR